jgi:serine/threonine-protein kinase
MRERLGSYELISLMSSGGMAELYLAIATGSTGRFRKVVAVKRMLPEARDNPEAVARFLDEAKVTVALDHRGIAQVFDLGEADGELFLAMEFVVGADLARIGRSGPVPAGFALYVAHEVAAALAYAYDDVDPISGLPRCVVHRDLTPRNVMVTFDGAVKIIDFGLAHFRGRVQRTAQGQVRGTPQYMAPEQLRGEKLDSRTDLYALGVTLWELLSGRELIPGQRQSALERAAFGEGAPPVSTVAPDTPPALARIVDTLLDPRPPARFQSARELLRAVTDVKYERFDAERAATLIRTRMPQTREILKSAVAMAADPTVDDAALDARIKELRRADRHKPVELVDVSTAPVAATSPQLRLDRIAVAVAVVGALAAVMVVLLTPREAPVRLRTGQPPETVKAMQKAHILENDGDLLEALAVVDGCRARFGPCPGLEALRTSITTKLAASPCGSDTAARARIADAMKLAGLDARLRALDGCRAGRRLHPLAQQAIARLQDEAASARE